MLLSRLLQYFKRHDVRSTEFVWRPSRTRARHNTLGGSAEIFVHVLESHYCSPVGFDFEGLFAIDMLSSVRCTYAMLC